MIYIYNDDALVENSVFTENAVEVSTIFLMSPGEDNDDPHRERTS